MAKESKVCPYGISSRRYLPSSNLVFHSELSRELNQLREQYGLDEHTDLNEFSGIMMDDADAEGELDESPEYSEEQASLVQILSELKAEVEL